MRTHLLKTYRRLAIPTRNRSILFHSNSQQTRPNPISGLDNSASENAPLNFPLRASPPHLDLSQTSFRELDRLKLSDEDRYFSESDIDSFYKTLMNTPPSQFTKHAQGDLQLSQQDVPILGPSPPASSKPVSTSPPKKLNQLSRPMRELLGTLPISTGLDLQILSSKANEMSIGDWQSLLLAAACELQSEKLIQVLRLMKTHKVDLASVTDSLLTQLAQLPQLTEAEQSIRVVSEAYQKVGLTHSSAFHQAQVHLLLYRSASAPSTAFQAASKYIQRLERAGTPPAPAIYLQLFEHLSYTSQRRASSLDLFNRIRLLAHPLPPISIWNATLKALASGASTEPERAMDLFLDLKSTGLSPTRETYNHLIRAMARARRPPPGTSARRTEAEKWYFSALRMMDRMIHEEGFRPDVQTYVALLEGCKRVGDLRRAKWLYGLLRREIDNTSSVESSDGDQWIHVRAVTLMMQTYASFVPANKLTHHSSSKNQTPIIIDEQETGLDSVDAMAEYRDIPGTKWEAIQEADRMMNQFLTDTGELRVRAETRAEMRKLSILIGSYLSVYAAHGDIAGLYAIYERLTISPLEPGAVDGTKALRITWIYLLVVERCEYVRSAERAGRIGRAAFEEWLGTRHWQSAFELVESIEARLISQLWAAWIRLQAKFGGVKESLTDLERFVKLYPIEETTLESPYLVFRHLEILHHRLKQNEDRQAEKRLLGIVKGYEKARMKAFVAHEESRRIAMQSVTTS
ncbi:hypothetical protein CROQUDRAFT_659686 [Cronartium quercuum f. sp. fusiforme G11]|uniref:Pentatricopeptide repeat-containing protein n=1 Tax=Cronartium quercuum f. sp. fusiforme G11 TaxID=708437 RepID=A0A9P6NEL0_9BASI|nr:hypothetical protein CROQUDRAFT_659686 [Cronartium quercuum f. sp. fusiforme G11]